eukprot:1700897-Heterocapsa_arctica.AAC.1
MIEQISEQTGESSRGGRRLAAARTLGPMPARGALAARGAGRRYAGAASFEGGERACDGQARDGQAVATESVAGEVHIFTLDADDVNTIAPDMME